MTTSTPSILVGYNLRASYADTDCAGVIHHARYLEMFERSRTEWLRQLKADPITLETASNLLIVIREVTLKFLQPGRLDDLLSFSHQIIRRGNSQFVLEQTVYRTNDEAPLPDDRHVPLCTGTFHLVCVNQSTMKSHPLPENIPHPIA